MAFDKCVMTYFHHYCIIQNCFTALIIICVLPIHPSLSQPLAATDPFTVSIVLPFPEWHIVGFIQYVAFSDWLLPLSNMHSSFLHVFSWLESSYIYIFFYYWITLHCLDVPYYVAFLNNKLIFSLVDSRCPGLLWFPMMALDLWLLIQASLQL